MLTPNRILFLGLSVFLAHLTWRLGPPLWSNFPDYAYGWAVPALCVFLFFKRWQDRPEPALSPSLRWLWGIIAPAALLLLPFVLVQEANLIWLLFVWLLALVSLALMLCLLWAAGGPAWVRHFFFPAAFFLIALPWPGIIEGPFTGLLTKCNATLSAEILNFIGVPAVRHGVVLEVSGGKIGIDDACSGIRSFHASLMLALLFGELARLKTVTRLSLVAAGISLTLALNLARTLALVYISAAAGTDVMNRWHDPLGTGILLCSFGGLWWISRLLSKRSTDLNVQPKPANLPVQISASPICWVVGSLLIWLLMVETSVAWWYGSAEFSRFAHSEWSALPPHNSDSRPITEAVRNNLKFDEGLAAAWRDLENHEWLIYYFRWATPSDRTRQARVQRAAGHHPKRCLVGSGLALQEDQGTVIFQVQNLKLPMRAFVFTKEDEPVYVFHSVTHDGLQELMAANENLARCKTWITPRIAAVLEGNRCFQGGVRTLEVATRGHESFESACAALHFQLETIVRVKPSEAE